MTVYKRIVKYVPLRTTKKSSRKYNKRKSSKKFTRSYKKW